MHFPFNLVKELELSHVCAKGQVQSSDRLFHSDFKIYGYTLFDMRRTLVCKSFFHSEAVT